MSDDTIALITDPRLPAMPSSFDHIRDTGFEMSLTQLIAYAEMQARLHQSLNDRDRYLFCVRSWAQLQRASDAIAFP